MTLLPGNLDVTLDFLITPSTSAAPDDCQNESCIAISSFGRGKSACDTEITGRFTWMPLVGCSGEKFWRLSWTGAMACDTEIWIMTKVPSELDYIIIDWFIGDSPVSALIGCL